MLLVIVLMLLLALLQAPLLANRKEWRELTAFGALWAFAFAYALAIQMDLRIPNPTEIIGAVLSRIYSLLGININI